MAPNVRRSGANLTLDPNLELAMRPVRIALALALALSAAPLMACGGASDEEIADGAGDESVDEARASKVNITEADNGKTFTAKVGQLVVLTLTQNASTGHQWKVVSTNRTFGYPTEKHIA